MNKGRNIGVPYAYFMVKTCTKQQNHGLIESQTQYASCVLFIYPFLLVVYCVPKDQFSIHSPARHKLKFGHRYHGGYQAVDLLVWCLVFRLLTFGAFRAFLLAEGLFQISFEVPHVNTSAFLSTIYNLIDSIPGQTIYLRTEVMLKELLLIIRLISPDKGTLMMSPAPYSPVASANNKDLVLFVCDVKHV